MTVGWGCCVGTWSKFEQNSKTWGPGPIHLRAEQTSISIAYNSILDEAQGCGYEALVLVHDDLEVIDPDCVLKVLAAMVQDVAIVGVCGGGPSMSWWDHNPIGHQTTDSLHLEFGGKRTGDVGVVEGSFLAFSPWAIEHLRFDEQLNDFHGYDADMSMQARAARKRVVVADVDTHHHSTVGFKSDKIAAHWHVANAYLRHKWNGEGYVG